MRGFFMHSRLASGTRSPITWQRVQELQQKRQQLEQRQEQKRQQLGQQQEQPRGQQEQRLLLFYRKRPKQQQRSGRPKRGTCS
jgi:hypothetical protein